MKRGRKTQKTQIEEKTTERKRTVTDRNKSLVTAQYSARFTLQYQKANKRSEPTDRKRKKTLKFISKQSNRFDR